MKIVSIGMYIVATIFIILGFNKMFVYEHSEYSLEDSINSYVGGDAYNYIINANYATAYFVLALLFTILGSTFLIIEYLAPKALNEQQSDAEIEVHEQARVL